MEAQDVFGIDFDPAEFGFGSDEEDDLGGENVLILNIEWNVILYNLE